MARPATETNRFWNHHAAGVTSQNAHPALALRTRNRWVLADEHGYELKYKNLNF
jgi:hypothetical protein